MSQVKTAIFKRICDQCGKEVESSYLWANPHPFYQWLHVTQQGSSIFKVMGEETIDKDFCGITCLYNWARGYDCQP